MLILLRIPPPYLMLMAGLCFGPNAALMSTFGGGDWPLWYGGIGSLGMGTMMLLGAVFYGWRQRIVWRFLLTRRASWRALPWILVSRVSFPMYVLAGAYLHYVIAGATTALLPGIQMFATWVQRRARDPQPFNLPALMAGAIGLVGGLLCVLAQPSTEGGVYLFVEPALAGVGVMLAVLSMASAAGQTCIYTRAIAFSVFGIMRATDYCHTECCVHPASKDS